MTYGIVDLANADMPIVMLDEAHLCQDCNGISAAPEGHCLKCQSRSLLKIERALNGGRSYSGACFNELMENETKDSLAELFVKALGEIRALRAQKGGNNA